MSRDATYDTVRFPNRVLGVRAFLRECNLDWPSIVNGKRRNVLSKIISESKNEKLIKSHRFHNGLLYCIVFEIFRTLLGDVAQKKKKN